jgi:hypothetical protein
MSIFGITTIGFVGLIILSTVIYEIVEGVRNMKKREDLRNTIAKGDKFVERFYTKTDNPFIYEVPYHAEVLDVKRNDKGDVWVKYEWRQPRVWCAKKEIKTESFNDFYYYFKKYNEE